MTDNFHSPHISEEDSDRGLGHLTTVRQQNIPCWHIGSSVGSWRTYSKRHCNRSTFCAHQANFVHSTVLARPKRVQTRSNTQTPTGFSSPNHLEYFIKPLLTHPLHLVHSLHLRRDALFRGLFRLAYVCRANSGCWQKKVRSTSVDPLLLVVTGLTVLTLPQSRAATHSRQAFPDLLVETFIRASTDSVSLDHQSQ